MCKKKVVIITTGGTIAMKYDEVSNGLVPAISGDDLIQAVPALKDVIPVEIVTDKETYNVYLLEDGVVTEVVSDEPAVEFMVEDPSADVEYHVGISPDDLGAVGDEVSVEDFARYEKIIFEIVEPVAEEE